MLNTIKKAASSLLSGLNSISGQSNQYSADAELKRAEDTQKRYSDAINTQYAAGIQNLQDQQKNLSLQYDPERASVNAQYERSVRNNAEQMANLGLTRSGTNLTAMTALENERARGLAEVNSAQDAANRQLQAQIKEYMAQRDSDIAKQSASIYENAYNNISAYERQLATMEAQNKYDKEMAALNHKYNQQMATLEQSYNLALQTSDYAQQRALKTEMAALEQGYKMQALEKQAELDNASYAQRAATDWNYYQQQAALDNKLALQQYNSKAATDWGYYQQQAALDNKYATALQQLKNASSSSSKNKINFVGEPVATTDDLYTERARQILSLGNSISRNDEGGRAMLRGALDSSYEEGRIADTEYAFLIRILGF
jgi:hypothetical protein